MFKSEEGHETYQGDAENKTHGINERKPSCIPIHPKLFQKSTETIANQERGQPGTNGIIRGSKEPGRPLGALLCLFGISSTLLLDLLPPKPSPINFIRRFGSTILKHALFLRRPILTHLIRRRTKMVLFRAEVERERTIRRSHTRPTRQRPSSTRQRRSREGKELFTETPDE
jgi:hypothetical protein